MSQLFPHAGPWTVDDLPEEGWYEIVDGALVVSPAPSPRHEVIGSGLLVLLAGRFGHARVLAGGGVTFSAVNYRIPDTLVLREGLDAMTAPSIGPGDALLVVEVVSPSSVTTDHITKRAQYARAGIPGYWIVETDPELRLTAMTLPAGGDVYAELGSWGEGERVAVDTPLEIAFELATLRG
ncbi:Uma2 family endonuclease [Nocardioides soli]|uniref:Uma2 family endonuclease n=1 Tax=Nocardioides soli TaxID=1036020 RepID=A0A7W4VYX1_9ACTN|nr:Uma2 family endonuclease [Nocardioides soli]MBB3044317.1 Uma2 family endonuclease [Nocardioides soli]